MDATVPTDAEPSTRGVFTATLGQESSRAGAGGASCGCELARIAESIAQRLEQRMEAWLSANMTSFTAQARKEPDASAPAPPPEAPPVANVDKGAPSRPCLPVNVSVASLLRESPPGIFPDNRSSTGVSNRDESPRHARKPRYPKEPGAHELRVVTMATPSTVPGTVAQPAAPDLATPWRPALGASPSAVSVVSRTASSNQEGIYPSAAHPAEKSPAEKSPSEKSPGLRAGLHRTGAANASGQLANKDRKQAVELARKATWRRGSQKSGVGRPGLLRNATAGCVLQCGLDIDNVPDLHALEPDAIPSGTRQSASWDLNASLPLEFAARSCADGHCHAGGGDLREQLKRVFRAADGNASGSIDLAEFEKMLRDEFGVGDADARQLAASIVGTGKLTFPAFENFFLRMTQDQPVVLQAMDARQQLAGAIEAAKHHRGGLVAFVQGLKSKSKPLRPDAGWRWALHGVLLISIVVDVTDVVFSVTNRGWYVSEGCAGLDWGFRAAAAACSGVSFALFLVEMLLIARTTSCTGWQLVEEPADIWAAYRGGWLAFDLVILLPLDLAFVLAGSCTLWRIARGPKVLRLLRVPTLVFRPSSPLDERPKMVSVLLFSFWCAVGVIVMATAWLRLAPEEHEGPESEAVVGAVYFVFTTLSSVGYGDISPATPGQRIFSVLVQLCGVLVLLGVGAVSTAFLMETDPISMAMKDRRRRFAAVIHDLQLPWEMQQQCFAVLPSIVESSHARHAELLDELPTTMRDQIEQYARVRLIRKVSFFAQTDYDVLLVIAGALRSVVKGPGECVVAKGDIGSEMFIIRYGCVEVTAPDDDGFDHQIATLRAGSWFGESALLCDTLRSNSVCTITRCEFFVLDKHPLLQLVATCPAFERQLRGELGRRGLLDSVLTPSPPSPLGVTHPQVLPSEETALDRSLLSSVTNPLTRAAVMSNANAVNNSMSLSSTGSNPSVARAVMLAADSPDAVRAAYGMLRQTGSSPEMVAQAQDWVSLLPPVAARALAELLIGDGVRPNSWVVPVLVNCASHADAVSLVGRDGPRPAAVAAALLGVCARSGDAVAAAAELEAATAAGTSKAPAVAAAAAAAAAKLADAELLRKAWAVYADAPPRDRGLVSGDFAVGAAECAKALPQRATAEEWHLVTEVACAALRSSAAVSPSRTPGHRELSAARELLQVLRPRSSDCAAVVQQELEASAPGVASAPVTTSTHLLNLCTGKAADPDAGGT
eukprot:TRINITY_DN13754_c0_g1_i1.p1 TRINITY_DN13754_c0_g1~~TRINITY_DN13754_c0_g1_i1.p1  ORF type:complete len:1229 (+),score=150.53 TRINITY_DN13754_c0_g1_i1:164-3850(+)